MTGLACKICCSSDPPLVPLLREDTSAMYWSISFVASDLPAPDSPLMMMDWSVRSESIPRYDSSATYNIVIARTPTQSK